MPGKTVNMGSEAAPHFDGKRDKIISDSGGKQIGVVSDFKQSKNALYTETKDHTEKLD
jgi:hypothetical protein